MPYGSSGYGSEPYAGEAAASATRSVAINMVSRASMLLYAYGTFIPPAPVPGPPTPIVTPTDGEVNPGHDYAIVPVNMYGVPAGQVAHAIATECSWVLDGTGDATIVAPTLDPQAEAWGNSLGQLMPASMIPGAVEVQIWRDGVPIWWGTPVTPRADLAKTTVQCSTLEWFVATRLFGPIVTEYLLNNQFEAGLTNWTAVGVTASVETKIVNEGKQAARLTQANANVATYLEQDVTLSAPSAEATFFDLSCWYYIDPAYTFTGAAFQQLGLVAHDPAGKIIPVNQAGPGNAFATITSTATVGQWTRLETGFTVPAGQTVTVSIRLVAPGGSIIFDSCHLHDEESVGSPIAGTDVINIINNVLAYIQDPGRGKSFLNFEQAGGPTGKVLERIYQFSDNGQVIDALNEFPTIGVCDWGLVWSADGTRRALRVFSPARGVTNYAATLELGQLAFESLLQTVDGSQTRTTVRVLGQDQSSGTNQDIGYAAFPSYLGGRVMTDAVLVQGSQTLASATANFTSGDVGQPVYILIPGSLPIGTLINSVTDSSHVVMSLPALVSATAQTLGIGGLTIDQSISAQPDQPTSTLNYTALQTLLFDMAAKQNPVIRLRADGPQGWMGRINLGDTIPIQIDYGWAQVPDLLLRIVKMTLYPPTEELEVTLQPIGPQPA